ncbi:MAG TPA: heme ABC exporter ATP-binding protein CcmA [Actinomycetota bacterium]|nr:heme ABC exporter ATP-binding protein CcmA [Actinomycetota bacterium]
MTVDRGPTAGGGGGRIRATGERNDQVTGLQSIGVGAPTDEGAVRAALDPPTGAVPAVRLTGVTRLFDRQAALRNVHLHVAPGEVVMLRGPNGAGKSTLLRIISTAIAPTYGTGSVLGHDLRSGRAGIRAAVELLGHRARLYEDLSARENLRFLCSLYGIDEDGIGVALQRVRLSSAADERVRSYSQGMRQRVAIARLLLRDPGLLLLDEPYGGLDEEGKGLVDELIADARTRGRTVLVATHDRSRDPSPVREVWMEDGRIVAGGA